MNPDRREALAARLDDAARHGRAIPQLSAEVPLTVPQAYAIQRASIDRRLARGEALAGV